MGTHQLRTLVEKVAAAVIQVNWRLSNAFDKVLPAKYRIDGDEDFGASFLPKFLDYNLKVYDVGGGKTPSLNNQAKRKYNLSIIGLDISDFELKLAPDEIYDHTICADICQYRGNKDGDLVICRALLEHAKDTESAVSGIASLINPGGRILIFVPSRNAVFARLNLLLPQKIKEQILYFIFPQSKQTQGFPAFYDKCTKKEFHRLMARHNLNIEEERYYFSSGYFRFAFPIHIIWRAWLLLFHAVAGNNAAETFCVCLKRNNEAVFSKAPVPGS